MDDDNIIAFTPAPRRGREDAQSRARRRVREMAPRDQAVILRGIARGSTAFAGWPLVVHGVPLGMEGARARFHHISGHRLVLGQTREGKFTSVVAPMLLHDIRDDDGLRAGLVIVDPKNGEAARITAEFRRQLTPWSPVMVLDPYGITGEPQEALNPLDFLEPEKPGFFERCHELAQAFVPGDGSTEDHEANAWREPTRQLLAAMIGHLAVEPGETRTLMRLREIFVAGGETLDLAAAAMATSQSGRAFIVEQGKWLREVRETAPRQWNGYLGQIVAATKFLSSEEVRRSLSDSTFDPKAVRDHGATLYVAVPDEHLAASAGWLRLMVELTRQRVKASLARRQVHIVIDEARALGSWELLQKGVRAMGSERIILHLVFQSAAGMKAVWGDHAWAEFAAVEVVQYLGSNDPETNEFITKLAGRIRLKKRTFNTGWSKTRSTGWSTTATRTRTQQDGGSEGRSLSSAQARGLSVAAGRTDQTSQSSGFQESETRGGSVSKGASSSTSVGTSSGEGGGRGGGRSTGDSFTWASNGSSFGWQGGASSSWQKSWQSSWQESRQQGESTSVTTQDSRTGGRTTTSTSGASSTRTETKSGTSTETSGSQKGRSWSQSTADAQAKGEQGGESDGSSASDGWTEEERDLTPAEVRKLDKSLTLVFIGRTEGVILGRSHYHQNPVLVARLVEAKMMKEEGEG